MMLFLLLIGYMVYWNVYERDAVLASPYNRRQDQAATRVIRGEIVSRDGQVLAATTVDEAGNETRTYPGGSTFAHAVGYLTHGKSGLESIENYSLMSSHVNLLEQAFNDLMGERNDGDTVITTLRADLQTKADELLGDRQGAILMMNPRSGAVYVMLSKPDFDPNTLGDMWDEIINEEGNSQLVNRATQGLYPPGSVFKMVTALAYLREVGTLEHFTFDCEGEYTVAGSTVHCAGNTVHGPETFASAFAHSCNCAFADIGIQAGANGLTKTASDLLFGAKLPISLLYNQSRFNLTPDDGAPLLMRTAFGQGNTLVTPYHIACITSAIANGGWLMKTQLEDSVVSTEGAAVSRMSPSKVKQLMTESEATVLTNMMRAVVTDGTGEGLNDLPFAVCGKTGSAEYTRSDGSIGTHAWFTGFAHPDDPDVVVTVLVEDGGSGAECAVPIARELFEAWENS